jgi:hypothetical protein
MNNAATTSATVTTLNPIPNATAQRSTALPVIDNFRFVNLYLSHRLFFWGEQAFARQKITPVRKKYGPGGNIGNRWQYFGIM